MSEAHPGERGVATGYGHARSSHDRLVAQVGAGGCDGRLLGRDAPGATPVPAGTASDFGRGPSAARPPRTARRFPCKVEPRLIIRPFAVTHPHPATTWTPLSPHALRDPPLAADDPSIHVWLLRGGRNDPRLRALVACYAGCAADTLALCIGAHGKPYLDGHGLRFNVSHSGDWTVLALGWSVELGVDLEHARRVRRRTALLERCFTPAERTRLASGGDQALLRYWAAKEALVKAIGRGIAYGLTQIEIGEHADGRLAVVALGGPAAPAARWQVCGFDPGEDGFGALAYEGPERPVVGFRAMD
jgi:4'-phosphopantetheinyl transferase